MQQNQHTIQYDWSKLPAIPDYPEDEETGASWRKKALQMIWPILVSVCLIPFLLYFHLFSHWWPWLGTALFAALFLRTLLTDALWKDKIVPTALFVGSIVGWWVVPGWFNSILWTNLLWPVIWPPLLGLLAAWLNTHAALLPWWWPWFRTTIIVILLMALSFFAGTLAVSKMGVLLLPSLPAMGARFASPRAMRYKRREAVGSIERSNQLDSVSLAASRERASLLCPTFWRETGAIQEGGNILHPGSHLSRQNE
jgi:hypothetical protein